MSREEFPFTHITFIKAIYNLPDYQQKNVLAFLKSSRVDAEEHNVDIHEALINCGAANIARTRDSEYEDFFFGIETLDTIPSELARDERLLAEFENLLQKNIDAQQSTDKGKIKLDPEMTEFINLKFRKVRSRNRVILWMNLRTKLSLLATNLVYPSLDRYHWPLFYSVVGTTVLSIGIPFFFALGFSSCIILLSIGTTFFDFISLFWLAWLFYISYILEIKRRSQIFATCLILAIAVYFLSSAHSHLLLPPKRVISNIFAKAVIQGILAVMSSIIYVFLFVEREPYKTLDSYDRIRVCELV